MNQPTYTTSMQLSGSTQQGTAQSSCIFIGNIPYDSTPQDLINTLALAGPFSQFRLKLDKDTMQPKGFGFCEYKDQDIAASALRNLNKYDLNRRELKVDFASDNKSGVNLRMEDVKYRDAGEVFLNGNWESVDEVLKSLSNQQEELLLYGIKEVYEQYERDGNKEGMWQMVENLAQDENLLERLTEMLDRHTGNSPSGNKL